MKNGTVIAITGQSGCGKSTLSNFYASKGYTVIDCDKVAKDVRGLTECKIRLADAFGQDIIVNGEIDKNLLAQKAFSSDESLQLLTDTTHPFIINEILSRINTAFEKGEKFVFVDGAVIIGHDFEKYCDKFVIVVTALDVQCQRLMKRDGITYLQAENRILKQTPYSDMLKKADYVIYNNKDIQSLIIQGEFFVRQIDNRGQQKLKVSEDLLY